MDDLCGCNTNIPSWKLYDAAVLSCFGPNIYYFKQVTENLNMEMVLWRQLLERAIASHSHLPHSKFCQLATVRPNGTPANRTVVFRGFVDGTEKLLFTTDSRTNKVQEAQHCSAAETCYYFTDSWEQFRIHGELDVIGHNEANEEKKMIREKAWFGSSLKSRYQYKGPHPGQPRSVDQVDAEVKLESSEGPLETFCVVTLQPNQVDYLHLRENRRAIFRCLSDRGWIEEAVNP